MSGRSNYNQSEGGFGQLMNHLIGERNHFQTDEEFKAFAIEEVRRFISDLRKLDIELTMRPHCLERSHFTIKNEPEN